MRVLILMLLVFIISCGDTSTPGDNGYIKSDGIHCDSNNECPGERTCWTTRKFDNRNMSSTYTEEAYCLYDCDDRDNESWEDGYLIYYYEVCMHYTLNYLED